MVRHYPRVHYFNPRSPHGERHFIHLHTARSRVFQPTLPARGATAQSPLELACQFLFQPTLPARGATVSAFFLLIGLFHFNPRSPHGERHTQHAHTGTLLRISTHAPRTGSDFCLRKAACRPTISTHAPRTGSDRGAGETLPPLYLFQPTLPARGATVSEISSISAS